jgi:hypothetical protein
LELTVSDARAVATGAVRVLGEATAPTPGLAAAVRAAADAVRTTEPAEARDAAERVRRETAGVEASLGASVVIHGVIAIAEHALRAADARDEDRRIAAELAARGLRRKAVSVGARYTFSRR